MFSHPISTIFTGPALHLDGRQEGPGREARERAADPAEEGGGRGGGRRDDGAVPRHRQPGQAHQRRLGQGRRRLRHGTGQCRIIGFSDKDTYVGEHRHVR